MSIHEKPINDIAEAICSIATNQALLTNRYIQHLETADEAFKEARLAHQLNQSAAKAAQRHSEKAYETRLLEKELVTEELRKSKMSWGERLAEDKKDMEGDDESVEKSG